MVVLTPDDINAVAEEEWEDICSVENSYVVFGNPFSLRMLKRVGLHHASVVLSVPPATDVDRPRSLVTTHLTPSFTSSDPDAKGLFLACALSTLCAMYEPPATGSKRRNGTDKDVSQSSASNRHLREAQGTSGRSLKRQASLTGGLFKRRDSWDVDGPALGDGPSLAEADSAQGGRGGEGPLLAYPRLLLELVSWSSLRFLENDEDPDANLAYLLRETGLVAGPKAAAVDKSRQPEVMNVESIGLDERCRMRPQFASGEVFFGANLDSLIVQLYYNPVVLDVLHHLLYGGSRSGRRRPRHYRYKENGTVQAMLIPSSYVNATYGELFSVLVKEHSVLPIGIYRSPKVGPLHVL